MSQVEAAFNGLVIGKGGSGIEDLRQMPGVKKVPSQATQKSDLEMFTT